MVPNGPRMITRFLEKHPLPYPVLTDMGARVAGQYLQVRQLFKLGTPSVFLVGRDGRILYALYASLLIDEPDNAGPLAVLAGLAAEGGLR